MWITVPQPATPSPRAGSAKSSHCWPEPAEDPGGQGAIQQAVNGRAKCQAPPAPIPDGELGESQRIAGYGRRADDLEHTEVRSARRQSAASNIACEYRHDDRIY